VLITTIERIVGTRPSSRVRCEVGFARVELAGYDILITKANVWQISPPPSLLTLARSVANQNHHPKDCTRTHTSPPIDLIKVAESPATQDSLLERDTL